MVTMRVLKWLIFSLMIFLVPALVKAESFQSNSYRIDESYIGGGGNVDSSSSNFRTDTAIGDVGVGEAASDNFQTQSGYVTTNDPALTFNITSSSINFGALSTSATSTGTANFSVINYTSYGYIVQAVGSPPSTGTYTLAGMTSTGPSQTGVEQFGINLRANSSPSSIGANPIGGYGVAATGYSTTNNYKYVSGDVIASAPRTSAQTDFTISYIVNASTLTGGGTYSGAQTLVCTGTY
jgi:hypothetical protein